MYYNIDEQIYHGVRENRRLNTNESASESSSNYGMKQCKNGIYNKRGHFVPMENGKAYRQPDELY
jgi:hypothetical protein